MYSSSLFPQTKPHTAPFSCQYATTLQCHVLHTNSFLCQFLPSTAPLHRLRFCPNKSVLPYEALAPPPALASTTRLSFRNHANFRNNATSRNNASFPQSRHLPAPSAPLYQQHQETLHLQQTGPITALNRAPSCNNNNILFPLWLIHNHGSLPVSFTCI
jgi:hypothetical protein